MPEAACGIDEIDRSSKGSKRAVQRDHDVAWHAVPAAGYGGARGPVIDSVEDVVDIDRQLPFPAQAIAHAQSHDGIETLCHVEIRHRPQAMAQGIDGSSAGQAVFVTPALRMQISAHTPA